MPCCCEPSLNIVRTLDCRCKGVQLNALTMNSLRSVGNQRASPQPLTSLNGNLRRQVLCSCCRGFYRRAHVSTTRRRPQGDAATNTNERNTHPASRPLHPPRHPVIHLIPPQ